MCAGDQLGAGIAFEAAVGMPREVGGQASDPIALEPVDSLVVTMLVDNSYDGLLPAMGPARRTGLRDGPPVAADGFVGSTTITGLVAEHGFSALITVRRGARSHTVLFDAGISPDGLAANMQRLGVDAGAIEAVVLSHGRFDHVGGLVGLQRLRGRVGLPMVVHPLVWSQRRIVLPDLTGEPEWRLPTLSRASLESEGFEVIERRQRSLLLDGGLLVTGEIDRTTDFEHGMPNHEALGNGRWEPDPLILDDQAVVVHVRGLGLIVMTGCGHAGAVNIARHALRLTGVGRLHGLFGGFHLSGPAFAKVIAPTVAALIDLAPSLLVPAHCTGWQAQHQLVAGLPDSFVPNSVGTVISLDATAGHGTPAR